MSHRTSQLAAALIWCCASLAEAQAQPQAQSPAVQSLPEAREVDVLATDGGFVGVPDAAIDAGVEQAANIPPSIATPSPAPYPEDLLGTRPSGTVQLELLISDQGAVDEVAIAQPSGVSGFDAAAVEAARKLVFHPATRGGAPVPVRIHFDYVFEAPPPAPALVTARLTGQVRAMGTRLPISFATLEADGADQPIVTHTDEGGRFTLELPPGARWIRVTAPGHKSAAFKEQLSEGETVDVVYAIQPLEVNPYQTIVRDERPRAEVSRVSLQEQEIHEVPGTMGDPFRVVMLMPGVASVASGISYPVVRGAQPASTGYFIDGVRVPMLFHLLLGPAVVHPDFIDGVDFYPGVAPARYGRLMGGVVEGQVSRPHEDRPHASAYADLINAGAFVEAPIAATGTNVTLSGRYSYTPWALALASRAFVSPDPEGYRTRAVADFWDYQGRIEQKLGPGRLRLLAFGSSDYVGTETDNPRSYQTHLYSVFHRVDLRYRHPIGVGELEVGATWGTERLGVTGDRGETRVGDYGLRTDTASARASWSATFSRALAASVGVEVDHRRASSSISSNDDRVDAVTGLESDTTAYRQPLTLVTIAGAFAELQWRPIPDLLVVPGVRADNYHLVPGIDHLAIDPRLTARWKLRDTLTLKAGAALLHQPPTVMLNLPVFDLAGIRHGLQQEWTVDAGAEWRPVRGFEITADAYYTHLDRAVEFTLNDVLNDSRHRGITLHDPGRPGRSFGIDLMVRHPLGERWFGWASYSFNQSQRYETFSRYDDDELILSTEEGWLPFAFEQAHVANVALSYRFTNNLTLGAVLHVNTGRPESGEVSSRNMRVVPDELTGGERWVVTDRDRIERLPPFWRVDLRLAYSRAFRDVVAEAYLDVLNVTVNREVLGYSYDLRSEGQQFDPEAPLRAVRSPIEIPLILPVLGVKVRY